MTRREGQRWRAGGRENQWDLSGGRDHDRLFSDFVPPIAVAERSTNDTILCYLRERTANGDAVRNTGLSEMADLTNWQYFLPNDHKRRSPPRINREDVTPPTRKSLFHRRA